MMKGYLGVKTPMGTVYYLDSERSDKESWIMILRHNFKKHRKCFRYTYYEKNGTNGYHIQEFWTDMTVNRLADMGFKRSDGFVDRLAYSFTKVYVRLEGFKESLPDDQETAESLRNMLESDAINDFKKGFAKTSMSSLEMKQIIVMIPVVLGVIFGVFLLMGGM